MQECSHSTDMSHLYTFQCELKDTTPHLVFWPLYGVLIYFSKSMVFSLDPFQGQVLKLFLGCGPIAGTAKALFGDLEVVPRMNQ